MFAVVPNRLWSFQTEATAHNNEPQHQSRWQVKWMTLIMATAFPWRTLGPHVHVDGHKVNPVGPTAPQDGHFSVSTGIHMNIRIQRVPAKYWNVARWFMFFISVLRGFNVRLIGGHFLKMCLFWIPQPYEAKLEDWFEVVHPSFG